METGSNNTESKGTSGDEAMTSPGQEPVVAAGGAGEDEVAPAAGTAGEEPAASTAAMAAPAASPKPYYECVFCKRGFTTAQALGGHMNIHRRDRARPTRDSPAGITTVSQNVECYNKYLHLLGSSSSSSYTPAQSIPIPIVGAGSSFGMYYTSSGASRLDAEGRRNPSSVNPRELSLFGEANRDQDLLHLGLGSHGHIGDGSRTPAEGSGRQESGESERELDLELRLGRRPRH